MTTGNDKWNTGPDPLDADMEAMLDGLFAQARGDDSDEAATVALMARIAADADAQIDARADEAARQREVARPRQRHPLVEAAVRAVGGWRSVGGMGFAAVVGLALGFGSPASVSALATGDWVAQTTESVVASDDDTYTLDDLVPSFYDLALEG